MTKQKITAERLRYLLNYDPELGLFFWKNPTHPRIAQCSIAGYSYNYKGYRQVTLDGSIYLVHRLAWLYVHGTWPNGMIDHINGVKSDNRIKNLRDVSPEINSQNIRNALKNSKTGFLGVMKNKNGKPFIATIVVNGKAKRLGAFDSAQDAHEAYLAAKRKYHAGCTI